MGRRWNSWLKILRKWFGCISVEYLRGAVSRMCVAMWIANLRRKEKEEEEVEMLRGKC